MSAPAVAVEGVSVRFGAREVLRGVSLEVPEGAFVGMIGPNGTGKTTLLRAILGLLTPDAGQVRLFGASPSSVPASAIGYVPQVKTLDRSFPAKAIELVATGLHERWAWHVGAVDRAKAIHAMRTTGVEHLATQAVSELSGGELQRVYLARCLVRQPRLLVLDEPAAGMDVTGEAEMYHLLEDYRKTHSATVLMITHDWEGARLHATHVLLMGLGEVAYGAPAEVATNERLLRVFGHIGHAGASAAEHHDA